MDDITFGKRLVLIFLAVGVTLLAGGAYLGWSTLQFVRRAVEAPAEVTQIVNGGYTYIIEYTDMDGDRQMLRLPKDDHYSFSEGEHVTVLYDPADPVFMRNAKVDHFMELWSLSLFLLVFGGATSAIAIAGCLTLFAKAAA